MYFTYFVKLVVRDFLTAQSRAHNLAVPANREKGYSPALRLENGCCSRRRKADGYGGEIKYQSNDYLTGPRLIH